MPTSASVPTLSPPNRARAAGQAAASSAVAGATRPIVPRLGRGRRHPDRRRPRRRPQRPRRGPRPGHRLVARISSPRATTRPTAWARKTATNVFERRALMPPAKSPTPQEAAATSDRSGVRTFSRRLRPVRDLRGRTDPHVGVRAPCAGLLRGLPQGLDRIGRLVDGRRSRGLGRAQRSQAGGGLGVSRARRRGRAARWRPPRAGADGAPGVGIRSWIGLEAEGRRRCISGARIDGTRLLLLRASRLVGLRAARVGQHALGRGPR